MYLLYISIEKGYTHTHTLVQNISWIDTDDVRWISYFFPVLVFFSDQPTHTHTTKDEQDVDDNNRKTHEKENHLVSVCGCMCVCVLNTRFPVAVKKYLLSMNRRESDWERAESEKRVQSCRGKGGNNVCLFTDTLTNTPFTIWMKETWKWVIDRCVWLKGQSGGCLSCR